MPTRAKPRAAKKPASRAAKKPSAAKRSALRAPAPTNGWPFIGQIEAFGFPFNPPGWLPCDGRLLAIAQNQPLFSLLATTYGGNGTTTFALPRLAPIGPNGPRYFIAVSGSFPNRG